MSRTFILNNLLQHNFQKFGEHLDIKFEINNNKYFSYFNSIMQFNF